MKGRAGQFSGRMTNPESGRRLPNYIRIHRRRVGLSQREMSEILGSRVESVARHEQFYATPDLQIAIGYELIFCIPVSELFAGLRDETATDIESKLRQLEEQLGQRSAKDRDANVTARKLAWLSRRKDVLREPIS
jgi:ribosome-binding protein aMBF1 (putative translation factor)